MNDELKDLDLSSKSFDQFVDFFFNRVVVPDKDQFDYFLTSPTGERYDEAVPSSPAVLVKHMTKLFSEFGAIANKYSLAQVDQAVWGILGANLRLYEFLFDASVPLPDRLECIRSIYHVYSDYVAKLEMELPPELSGFDMWWDLTLHGFWTPPRPFVPGTWRGDASKLDSESRCLLDVVFETLKRILLLPNRECQKSALHGLGHLYHPDVRDTVQEFIDANKSDFSLKWLEQCRDCDVWLANCYFAHNSLRFPSATILGCATRPFFSLRKDQLLNANHFLLTFGFRGMVINDSQRSSDTVA